MLHTIDPQICNWSTPDFLIFSPDIAGNFLYYSHLFPAISGLIIAIFVLKSNYRNKAAQALLFTTLMFSIWAVLDLVSWAANDTDILMFAWSALIYPELLMNVGAFYFIYAFFRNSFPPIKTELLIFLSFVPLLLFGHTKLNLLGFNFMNCSRYAVEGPLWQYYVYGFDLFYINLIVLFALREIKKRNRDKREATLVTLGILSFLFLFLWQNIVGSFFDDWKLGQIGLLGMPIFVALLGYILVRYQTFRVKLLATEALMAGQLILLISLLFVRTIETAQVIAIITILFFATLGVLLVKSVRNEVEQREEIQKLAINLKTSNEQLKIVDRQKSEFVSIASHQLRSPLTAIRGYTSMMLDGNFGPAPEKMKEPILRIHESAKLMALSIEDFLNVSRIESGNIAYEITDFNLKTQAEHIVDDLRPEAVKAGLLLLSRTDVTGNGMVHADAGKVHQILHNMINNALKYTPKGTITVYIHDDKPHGQLCIEVIDTGIGIAPDIIDTLFQKFARAKNANQVNINGTGLGLFVARAMARAMHGDITVASAGEGKGSKFTLTLPLAK